MVSKKLRQDLPCSYHIHRQDCSHPHCCQYLSLWFNFVLILSNCFVFAKLYFSSFLLSNYFFILNFFFLLYEYTSIYFLKILSRFMFLTTIFFTLSLINISTLALFSWLCCDEFILHFFSNCNSFLLTLKLSCTIVLLELNYNWISTLLKIFYL